MAEIKDGETGREEDEALAEALDLALGLGEELTVDIPELEDPLDQLDDIVKQMFEFTQDKIGDPELVRSSRRECPRQI